ncbi:MAG: WYL domain-containing protein [Clostridium sp.]|nr:WYL domain-containing protein [Clostridium sp.]
MAKSSNQKLKLVYLMKILLEKTDETHSITMSEIIDALQAYGIGAERKSLYDDLETLRVYGMDIIGTQEDRKYYYHVGNRQFELAELKLLVDSVQSAKFITEGKSNELIKKIEGLASQYEASQLHRQVFVNGRVKTMNESIYYNVDRIHTAIAENSRIRFRYFQWNVDKEMELRHNGAVYEVSPWALSWDDENYYLIAYDSIQGIIKHFRVDKMLNIESSGEQREGKQMFKSFNMAAYARKTFGMYGGVEEWVRIKCDNSLAGVMIDRFGKDVSMTRLNEKQFVATVDVAVSRQFMAWVIGLGDGAEIIGPESVVDEMRKEIKRLAGQYGRSEE